MWRVDEQYISYLLLIVQWRFVSDQTDEPTASRSVVGLKTLFNKLSHRSQFQITCGNIMVCVQEKLQLAAAALASL